MKLIALIRRQLILLTLLSALFHNVGAQSNLVFYNSPNQFNSSNYNPANLTEQKQFTFSIFPLSGMNVGYNNQTVINKMLRNVLRGDTTQAAFKDVFTGLVNNGQFSQRFESSLLTFGYNSVIGSFNFRVRDVEQMRIDFKGDFTSFILNPDFQTLYVNRPQFMPALAMHYREYSLGFAREIIKDRLTLGIRAKLYFGKASFVSEFSGSLNPQGDNYSLNTSGLINLSAPVKTVLNDKEILQPFETNENFTVAEYLFNSSNPGAGIDIGLTYQINSQVTFSASLTDLGKISWGNDLNTLLFKGEIELTEDFIQEHDEFSVTKKPEFDAILEDNFGLFKVDKAKYSYSTTLPMHIYTGFQYQYNSKLALGVVNRFIYLKNLSQNSFSLTTKYELNKKVTFSSGYSVIGKSYFNIPFGIVYEWGSGQSYFGTDNLFSFFLPNLSDFSGVTFGTSFYLFRKKIKYKDTLEYLPFYKQKK